MLVSIIIPAYNAEQTLGKCLDGCLAQSYPDTEVIVVDDGSTDGTKRVARAYGASYIRQENGGPAKARNTGARVGEGKVLAFTDSDCVPEPDWIERLLEGLDEGVVAVGGAYGIANPENTLAQLVHEEIAVRHSRFSGEVDFLGSFNAAYKKAAFDAVGGFDEAFRIASAEDNDLAYRLADGGGVLRFTRAAVVRHYHPARLWPYLKTQMWHGFWRMRLYAKHPRRAKGDRYADRREFAGPPLSLLLAFVIVLHFLTVIMGGTLSITTPTIHFGFGFGYATFDLNWSFVSALPVLFVALVYSVLKGSLRKELLPRLGYVNMFRFIAMDVLRDVARGIGLIRGVWTFLIRRRETV
ncbi:MAG: glycosyltransferase [Candidatus Hydrogenedentes bacterium]|nr:glycosyltransferase [Candidatus Hydrogenedentota bacterium]